VSAILGEHLGDRVSRFGANTGWASLAMSLVLLAGCGSSPSATNSVEVTIPSNAGGGRPPAAASGIDITTLSARSQLTLTRSGGYTFGVEIAIGAPVHISPQAILTAGGMTLTAGTACAANPATDAAVPLTVTVTNHTSGFPAVGSYSLAALQVDAIGNEAPDLEEAFETGPTCHGMGGGAADASGGAVTRELNPDSSSTSPAFVIIHNYYSPAAPDGDKSLLHTAYLLANGSVDESNNQLVASAGAGLGVKTEISGVAIPLDGHSLPL